MPSYSRILSYRFYHFQLIQLEIEFELGKRNGELSCKVHTDSRTHGHTQDRPRGQGEKNLHSTDTASEVRNALHTHPVLNPVSQTATWLNRKCRQGRNKKLPKLRFWCPRALNPRHLAQLGCYIVTPPLPPTFILCGLDVLKRFDFRGYSSC